MFSYLIFDKGIERFRPGGVLPEGLQFGEQAVAQLGGLAGKGKLRQGKEEQKRDRSGGSQSVHIKLAFVRNGSNFRFF